jgi:uncharacterized protein
MKEVELPFEPGPVPAENELIKKAASRVKIPARFIIGAEILRRSVDARGGRIIYRYLVRIATEGEMLPPKYKVPEYKDVHDATSSAIVIGAGPAGLFSALKLMEGGIKPIIIERGADVGKRKRDISELYRSGIINPDSNYCFGEGGAGTFSDGKLYTRSTKRGDASAVLSQFVYFGASEDILIDSHPHIGSDKLPAVIEKIRNCIIEHGGEIHFNTAMRAMKREGEEWKVLCDSQSFNSKYIILAAGHSSKEIYELFYKNGWPLEAKGFAMGVRVEHKQSFVNNIRYHGKYSSFLPSAEYSQVCQVAGRGVFSFCMCPGGILVPSMTSSGEIVMNGMSNSHRNSKWANAGVVVQIEPADIEGSSPLKLLKFQESVEKRMFNYVKSMSRSQKELIKAPAQTMEDFIIGRISKKLPETSYMPGVVSAPLHELLPDFVAARLKKAFVEFDKKMRGYRTPQALLLGVESRTSSPVRILRDAESLQCVSLPGIYPCGEGAGYSGGIISSAIDGINAAVRIIKDSHND